MGKLAYASNRAMITLSSWPCIKLHELFRHNQTSRPSCVRIKTPRRCRNTASQLTALTLPAMSLSLYFVLAKFSAVRGQQTGNDNNFPLMPETNYSDFGRTQEPPKPAVCIDLMECTAPVSDECVPVLIEPYRKSPYRHHQDNIRKNASYSDILFDLYVAVNDEWDDLDDSILLDVLLNYLCPAGVEFIRCMASRLPEPIQCPQTRHTHVQDVIKEMWLLCFMDMLDSNRDMYGEFFERYLRSNRTDYAIQVNLGDEWHTVCTYDRVHLWLGTEQQVSSSPSIHIRSLLWNSRMGVRLAIWCIGIFPFALL